MKSNGYVRSLYEIAEERGTTVGELTGSRRRHSTIRLPEPLARRFGLNEAEALITIEHHDEGLSASEIPFIRALWEVKAKEAEDRSKKR